MSKMNGPKMGELPFNALLVGFGFGMFLAVPSTRQNALTLAGWNVGLAWGLASLSFVIGAVIGRQLAIS